MKVSRDSYSSYTALAYHARTHARTQTRAHGGTHTHTHTHTYTQLSLPVVYAFSFISLFASARHITSLPLVSYIPSYKSIPLFPQPPSSAPVYSPPRYQYTVLFSLHYTASLKTHPSPSIHKKARGVGSRSGWSPVPTAHIQTCPVSLCSADGSTRPWACCRNDSAKLHKLLNWML